MSPGRAAGLHAVDTHKGPDPEAPAPDPPDGTAPQGTAPYGTGRPDDGPRPTTIEHAVALLADAWRRR
jgi:hypothetical protein